MTDSVFSVVSLFSFLAAWFLLYLSAGVPEIRIDLMRMGIVINLNETENENGSHY